ncbi:DNA-binding transcriptional regulator, LysR family [Lentzea albidocapillata subsp. violacea]|uniref:DNA-binding transcriptional regulator, LysR family n=1 Tax=Lentzea albidocapillata subsp. violacea TaxID=128104 RepID=A0A1G9GTF4_9PSEU|nr:LysR family transcriptional regulator [Lentzea albidocapillata]SDL03966.1 DNA-binding transcriptional regulator, LysR family [Lentzea albidocapillata subsp. violacea]
MPELELRHLRAVRTIAEEGSVTRAATRLGLTQPALSAQLRTVERLVGGQLFDRTRNGCVPTDLGRRVLGTARLVLDEMAQLMANTRETDRRGPLFFGCPPILYFARLVEGLRGLNADVRAEVRPSSAEIVDMLEAGQIHVALFEFFDGMHARDLAGIELRKLVTEPAFVALPETDPLAAQEEVDLASLADRDWVTPPKQHIGSRTQMFQACADAGFVPRLTHHTGEASMARGLVAAGCVSFAAAPSRTGEGIVIRRLRGMPLMTDIFVATRRDSPVAGRAHEVFACAAEAYRSVLDRNPEYRRWWDAHPEAHPEFT